METLYQFFTSNDFTYKKKLNKKMLTFVCTNNKGLLMAKTYSANTNQYLECCMYFTSNTMNRLINKMTEDAFMPTGLAPSYAFLMMVVIEEKSIGIGSLAETLKLAPSTVTRFVDKLITKGYLKRSKKEEISQL